MSRDSITAHVGAVPLRPLRPSRGAQGKFLVSATRTGFGRPVIAAKSASGPGCQVVPRRGGVDLALGGSGDTSKLDSVSSTGPMSQLNVTAAGSTEECFHCLRKYVRSVELLCCAAWLSWV